MGIEDTKEEGLGTLLSSDAVWTHWDCHSKPRTYIGLNQMGSQCWEGKQTQAPIPNPPQLITSDKEKLSFFQWSLTGYTNDTLGSIPGIRWPTKTEPIGFFKDLYPTVICLGFFFFSLQIFCLYGMVFFYFIFRGFLCVQMCVCLHNYISHPFLLTLSFSVYLFSPVLVCFFLLYLILLQQYTTTVFWRERKRCRLSRWERGRI